MLKGNEYIKRADKAHGGKYDYSKTVYSGMLNKVTIICPIHGEFIQKANNHIQGQGCPKCSFESRCNNNKRSLKQFIVKANKVHGDKYDYSEVEYVNSLTKVTIICPIHGKFEQTPANHLRGYGCRKCGMEGRNRK